MIQIQIQTVSLSWLHSIPFAECCSYTPSDELPQAQRYMYCIDASADFISTPHPNSCRRQARFNEELTTFFLYSMIMRPERHAKRSNESATRLVPGRLIRNSVMFCIELCKNARKNFSIRSHYLMQRIDAVDRVKEHGLRTRNAEVVLNTVLNMGFRRQYLSGWMEESQVEMERKGPYGDEAWNWDVRESETIEKDNTSDEGQDQSKENDVTDNESIANQSLSDSDDKTEEEEPGKKYVRFQDDATTTRTFTYENYEIQEDDISDSEYPAVEEECDDEEGFLPMAEQISVTDDSNTLPISIPESSLPPADTPSTIVARSIGARRRPALRLTTPSAGVPSASNAALFATEPVLRTKEEFKASSKPTIPTCGLAELSVSIKRAGEDANDEDEDVRPCKRLCS